MMISIRISHLIKTSYKRIGSFVANPARFGDKEGTLCTLPDGAISAWETSLQTSFGVNNEVKWTTDWTTFLLWCTSVVLKKVTSNKLQQQNQRNSTELTKSPVWRILNYELRTIKTSKKSNNKECRQLRPLHARRNRHPTALNIQSTYRDAQFQRSTTQLLWPWRVTLFR